MGTKIVLNSGRVFDFANPEACDYVIEDFAHSLANQTRWTGHTRIPYSIAEHCFHVSTIVPQEFRMQALCHELVESLMGDCNSSLKYFMTEFREIEHKIEAIVFARFGINYPMDKCVKEADNILLITEARDLMPKETLGVLDIPKSVKPLKKVIQPWSPKKAKRKFLERYYELKELES